MEILQEIGSYAGFAAVVGLAVLSALYFSQARDVKRLREWAGRAPERVATPPAPRSVVAQPLAKPGQPAAGRPAPPPVPRPPGAVPQPAAAQSAAGAAPAIAKGPAAATPAAAAQAAEASPQTGEGDARDGEMQPPAATNGEAATAPDAPPAQADDGTAMDDAGTAPDDDGTALEDDGTARGDDEGGLAGGGDPEDADDGDEVGDDDFSDADGDVDRDDSSVRQETDEWDPVESGEWRPEDEHSDLDLPGPTREPAPASATRPPSPPQPYRPPSVRAPSRAAPMASGRPGGDRILPPYPQSRRQQAQARGGAGGGTALKAGGAALALAIAVFAVFQLTGGDEPSTPAGGGSPSGPSDSADGAPERTPIDPSSVTVAVLNGTLVPGLAAQMGDKLRAQDFQVGEVTNNYDQELAESVVLYAPGAEREAADVGRRLDIPQREQIDPDSQALAGDASVVVVTGADLTQ